MVEFYVLRIKMGRMTLEEVPKRWREQVRLRLIEDGWLPESEKKEVI